MPKLSTHTVSLNKRQRTVLRIALSSALANIDDINDAAAHFTDRDPDNERGLICVDGKVQKSIDGEEIKNLAALFDMILEG